MARTPSASATSRAKRSTPTGPRPRASSPRCWCRSHPSLPARRVEASEPAPGIHDRLITRRALERGWPRAPFEARALVIRTLPNPPEKKTRDYSGQTPPYLSREAAAFLVERGIEHLIVDLPSIDREHDAGLLTAHRIFFGMPAAAVQLRGRDAPATPR